MKYMMLIASDENDEATGREEATEVYERIAAWWGEHAAAGRITEGQQLQPSATATTVRVDSGGSPVVTDGPYMEAKEVVGGYGILEVANLDEAISVASGWPGKAALELRPIVERGA